MSNTARRRAWSRAPLLTKGFLVIFLPILVMTLSSVAVFVTGRAHHRAEHQREAAESVQAAVDDLQAIVLEGEATLGESFSQGVVKPDPVVEQLILRWDAAVETLEAASDAQHDGRLRAAVDELKVASDELFVGVREWQSSTQPPSAELTERVVVALTTIDSAGKDTATRAVALAETHAHDYERLSGRLTKLLVVGTPLGIASAVIGMIIFARSIVRRGRLLEANARALGEGRSLIALAHEADELGQLGSGLDRAAALLGERERALEGARASLEHLLDAGPLVAFRMSDTGTLTYVSQSVKGLLGWRPSELVQTRGLLCVHPDDQPAARARALAVQSGEVDTPGELRFSTKDGCARWFNLSLKIDDQSPSGDLLGYALDIDGERDAVEAVRGSERRLALALDAGALGTWDVDLISGVAEWSERCERAHGLAPGTFGGSFESWMDAVHPDDRSAVIDAASVPAAEGGQWTSEYRSVSADESVCWVETHGQAITDERGTVVRLVGVSADVTARRTNEAALRDATAEAERANAAKSDFLSRVSHELRTPLNAILGFGQLLEMEDLSGGQMESVDQVLRGGRHLLAVIDDVLDISCIESGTLSLSMEPVDVTELLKETIALVAPFAHEHGVRLEVSDAGGVDLHVRADRRRLKQVILNLASNAIKYNHVGGVVTFRCASAERGSVLLDVTDTGTGIAPELVDRLFTPFDRLGAEQTDVQGAGIGLALSLRLAELLGGTITVASTPGEGSTFSLQLPAAEDILVSASDIGEEPWRDHRAGARGTILYIEDNPSNLKLLQRLLERLPGIRLLSATTGELGLSMAARIAVDVILLDLHLPDLSGEQVMRRLRDSPETLDTPIVIVSADATPGRLESLLAAGAADYLTKPLDLSHVLRVIDDLLTGVRS